MNFYRIFKNYILIFILTITFSLVFIYSGFAATLEHGDIGPRVEELQGALRLIGKEVEADGVFGADTKSALESFQKENNIVVDGIYGSETREAISAKLVDRLDTTTYKVKQGDTLSHIAEKQDTSLEKIMILNELDSVAIKPGDKLEVPEPGQLNEVIVGRGGENSRISEIEENEREKSELDTTRSERDNTFTYTVKRGDTLAQIAFNFEVDIDNLRNINNLSDNTIYAGQEIKIPGSDRNYEVEELNRIDFAWPTTGRITSDYGHRQHPVTGADDFHTGIDIAVSHGTPIKASASGIVIYAGWKTGYGYTVKIDHGGDIKTLYAHNSQLNVSQGDNINRGEVIAYSGNSGTSTGPHLHFEIIKNNNHVNPLQHLP